MEKCFNWYIVGFFCLISHHLKYNLAIWFCQFCQVDVFTEFYRYIFVRSFCQVKLYVFFQYIFVRWDLTFFCQVYMSIIFDKNTRPDKTDKTDKTKMPGEKNGQPSRSRHWAQTPHQRRPPLVDIEPRPLANADLSYAARFFYRDLFWTSNFDHELARKVSK